MNGVHDYAGVIGNPAIIGQVDFSYPPLAQAQPGRDNGGWAEVQVFYAVGVDAGTGRASRHGSQTDTPLLLRQAAGRRTRCCGCLASGLENLTNDLPLHPVLWSRSG